ncbi:hypothetical protein GVAV_003331 [Gurleya vavrai]
MTHFINNTPILYKKIQFLSKKHSKVHVSQSKLSTPSIQILLPPFTSATFTTNIKNLQQLLDAKDFEIKNNFLIYFNMCQNIKIEKKIEIEFEKYEIMKSNNYIKIIIEKEICNYIGKIKNFEKVNVEWKNNFLCFRFDDNIFIEVKFESEKIESFNMKSRDLWFMNLVNSDCIMCVGKDLVQFCLYEDECETLINVQIID